MTKEERAIIDKFLAKSKLQTEYGRGTPIRSVADLEAFEEEKKFKSARVKRMTDLAEEYRHKIKRKFWTGDADHMAQMVMHPGFRRNLWDYSDDEFEMLLRVARAILEGLARGVPAEADEKGARGSVSGTNERG